MNKEDELNALIEELKTKIPHDILMNALNDLYNMPKSELNDLANICEGIDKTTSP